MESTDGEPESEQDTDAARAKCVQKSRQSIRADTIVRDSLSLILLLFSMFYNYLLNMLIP